MNQKAPGSAPQISVGRRRGPIIRRYSLSTTFNRRLSRCNIRKIAQERLSSSTTVFFHRRGRGRTTSLSHHSRAARVSAGTCWFDRETETQRRTRGDFQIFKSHGQSVWQQVTRRKFHCPSHSREGTLFSKTSPSLTRRRVCDGPLIARENAHAGECMLDSPSNMKVLSRINRRWLTPPCHPVLGLVLVGTCHRNRHAHQYGDHAGHGGSTVRV